MKEITLNLIAGNEVEITQNGNYFRLLEGGADISVEFPDLNIKTLFKVGLGVQFEIFKTVRIRSDVNQKIVIAIALGRVDDSRLTGSINAINQGGSSYSAPSVVALSAGVAKEILVQDSTRLKGSIQGDADIYLGSDNSVTVANGIKSAGDVLTQVDNTAAVWAISAVATNVRVLEEYL